MYNSRVPVSLDKDEIRRHLRDVQTLRTWPPDSVRLTEGTMNATPISILMYERNAHLAQSLQWTLQSRGYRVVTVSNLNAIDAIPLTPSMNLLVLSQSLSPKECMAATAHASSRWANIKLLTLDQETLNTPVGYRGKKVQNMSVPERLLSTVSELVGNAASSSCSHTY